MLIINADDFGYSDNVNRAIAECFQRGYCTSTTIMANMPAFEKACELAHEWNFADQVGIHLVLIEGEPLSEPIRRCRRFCDPDGRFCLTRKERVWRLSASEKAAVAEELRAQIARCREFGIPLSHADSHEHAHEEWGILAVMIRACIEERIPRIRAARNCGRPTGPAKVLYRALLNRMLQRRALARTEFFGSLEDVQLLLRSRPEASTEHSVEVMVHPQYLANGSLVDYTPPSICPAPFDRRLSEPAVMRR